MNCPRCNRTIVGAEGWCVVHGSASDYGYRPLVESHRDSWPVDGRPGHPRGVARNQRLFDREIRLPGFEG